jgi:hypothetical protein
MSLVPDLSYTGRHEMLTDGWMAAYRVKLMNFFTLNSAVTAAHGAASGHSADPFIREKSMDNLTGRRMKWPFSVVTSSIARTSVAPEVATVYSDENRSNHFVT